MLSNNLTGEIRSNVNFCDFTKVFRVFSDAPFFEYWTPEKVLETYQSFDVKDGIVFGYYINDEIVGLLTLRPHKPGEYPVDYPDDAKVMYLSDIGTLPEYRGKGIGTELMQHGVRHAKVLGYNKIYLRTNEKGSSMSYGIAKKCGFNQIWDVCQEVNCPRTNPNVKETDLRIFMEKNL